jgi:hypothetical protein
MQYTCKISNNNHFVQFQLKILITYSVNAKQPIQLMGSSKPRNNKQFKIYLQVLTAESVNFINVTDECFNSVQYETYYSNLSQILVSRSI